MSPVGRLRGTTIAVDALVGACSSPPWARPRPGVGPPVSPWLLGQESETKTSFRLLTESPSKNARRRGAATRVRCLLPPPKFCPPLLARALAVLAFRQAPSPLPCPAWSDAHSQLKAFHSIHPIVSFAPLIAPLRDFAQKPRSGVALLDLLSETR